MATKSTYVYLLLDETGSMLSYISQTISGFNEYIQSLKKNKGFIFSLTLFNSVKTELRYKEVNIEDVEELTLMTYSPDSTTPLYDAIGRTINEASKSRRKKDKVLFVIFTDGLENASKEFRQDQIFSLISQKRSHGWEFVYLGANQDAWAVGATLGVDPTNTSSFNQSKTRSTFSVAAAASASYAQGSRSGLIGTKDSESIQ